MSLLRSFLNALKTARNWKSLELNLQCVDTEHFHQVLPLLSSANTRQEPFAKCVKSSLSSAFCRITDYHLYNILQSNLSVMAQNINCEVVGVVLNGILKKTDLPQNEYTLSQVQRPKILHNLNVIQQHNENSKIFAKFGVDEVSDIRLIAVHRDYNYELVAKQLLNLTENRAQALQMKIIKGDFSNNVNKKLLKSCNFSPSHETPYWAKPGPRAEFTPFYNMQMFYKQLE